MFARLGLDYDVGLGDKTFRQRIEEVFNGSGFDAYGRKIPGESDPYGRIIDA